MAVQAMGHPTVPLSWQSATKKHGVMVRTNYQLVVKLPIGSAPQKILKKRERQNTVRNDVTSNNLKGNPMAKTTNKIEQEKHFLSLARTALVPLRNSSLLHYLLET